jgi:hypothetical protein
MQTDAAKPKGANTFHLRCKASIAVCAAMPCGVKAIPPLHPGEGRVRAKQSQGARWRFLDRHTLICKLL